MSSHEFKRWPADIPELCSVVQKGDTVSVDELEVILRTHRGAPAFRIRAENLGAAICKHFEAREPSLIVTITYPKSGLHICTDEEAVNVCAKKFRRDLHGLRQAHRKAGGILSANLPAAAKRALETHLFNQVVVLSAISAVQRRGKPWIKTPEPALAPPDDLPGGDDLPPPSPPLLPTNSPSREAGPSALPEP